jgi:hypothetical protein
MDIAIVGLMISAFGGVLKFMGDIKKDALSAAQERAAIGAKLELLVYRVNVLEKRIGDTILLNMLPDD